MALLKNEHISLRALEPDDLAFLYRMENDTELWNVGQTLAPYSRYVLKQYLAESHRDIYDLKQLRLVIEYKATAEAVGLIDLFDFDPHHRRAGMGILLDRAYWGKGIATEAMQLLCAYAFSFLHLHQLYAHVPVGNKASHALFLRSGFTVAGTLTDWLVDGEGYQDVFVMQLFANSTVGQSVD